MKYILPLALIFSSLGAYADAVLFPEEKYPVLAQVFSKAIYLKIEKYVNENESNLSPNIKLLDFKRSNSGIQIGQSIQCYKISAFSPMKESDYELSYTCILAPKMWTRKTSKGNDTRIFDSYTLSKNEFPEEYELIKKIFERVPNEKLTTFSYQELTAAAMDMHESSHDGNLPLMTFLGTQATIYSLICSEGHGGCIFEKTLRQVF